MSKIKYIPSEVDGVNQAEECERLLVAADTCLEPAVDGYNNVRDWILNSGTTDHHAGWFHIIAAQVVTVVSRKQMRISGPLQLDGTLIIDGQFVSD